MKIPCSKCIVLPVCKATIIKKGRNGVIEISNHRCSLISDYILKVDFEVNLETEVFYTRIIKRIDEVVNYITSEDKS